jgi:spore maturation protein CgeB
MTAPRGRGGAFAGVKVVLVAAFNRKYHRSGLSLADALHSLGAEVVRCEERRRGLLSVFSRQLSVRVSRLVRRERPDLVLVFKGARLDAEGVAGLKRQAPNVRWALWYPDDPHNLDLSLRLGPAYDALFTHDSWSLPQHRAAGSKAHYLAFGCDPMYHRPIPAGKRWTSEIVFVGSRDAARERALTALPDLPIRIHGPGWLAGPVYGDDFVRALSNAKLGLNIHQHFGENGGAPDRYGHGANMRVFELAAVGTPQLADAKGDIARHFAPHKEIALYKTVDELKEMARALLADDARRKAMAEAARTRALREHTWAQRLEELLTVTLR